MQIQDFSIWEPLIGGILICLALAALMYFNGKIAGISGIFRGLLILRGDRVVSNVHWGDGFGGPRDDADFTTDVC